MKCKHPDYMIYHRDFGEFVLEFCVARCSYKKRLYGEDKKKWQEILAKGTE